MSHATSIRPFVPGPRQEDAAFDGLAATPARPGRTWSDPTRSDTSLPYSVPEYPTSLSREASADEACRLTAGYETHTGGREPDAWEPRGRGHKGRTFAGVAAAALTTALAVAVSGQPGGPPVTSDLASGDLSRQDDKASRSQGRPTPQAPSGNRRARERLSLHERLSGTFPLARDLALSGRFTTVKGVAKGTGTGSVVRYRVDVEKDLPLDGDLFAELVHETLNDPRSWGRGGTRTFERVSSGAADFVITLASPGTTDVWCAKSGLDTSAETVSCDSASTERIMVNAYRWARGAATFGDDMLGYRQMLINHEVGHRLGRNHESCPADGAPAPVMMQQTKYLSTDGATCKPNPWPFP